jgi:hypothetical protein
VLRSCVLLDELIEAEGPEGASGPIVVAQASVCGHRHTGDAATGAVASCMHTSVQRAGPAWDTPNVC